MKPIKYDGPITIATGSSRKSVSWKNEELLWSALAKRLETVLRTQETQDEYKSMPKAKRDEIKDVGGFVGGRRGGFFQGLFPVLRRGGRAAEQEQGCCE